MVPPRQSKIRENFPGVRKGQVRLIPMGLFHIGPGEAKGIFLPQVEVVPDVDCKALIGSG